MAAETAKNAQICKSTLPYNHSMEIFSIWKYGATSADTETPQEEVFFGLGTLKTKTKIARYIS